MSPALSPQFPLRLRLQGGQATPLRSTAGSALVFPFPCPRAFKQGALQESVCGVALMVADSQAEVAFLAERAVGEEPSEGTWVERYGPVVLDLKLEKEFGSTVYEEGVCFGQVR